MNTQFRTMSGKMFDLVNPRAEDVDPDDMVTALARIPRYNAHTVARPGKQINTVWSVADHLALCWSIAILPGLRRGPKQMLDLILHDGPETWHGDMTSPLKMALRALGGGEALREIENRADEAMRKRFGMLWLVDDETHKWIKRIDLYALHIEQLNFSHLTALESASIMASIPEDVRVAIPRLRPLSETARASQFRFLLEGAAHDVIAVAPEFKLTGLMDLATLTETSTSRLPAIPPDMLTSHVRREEFSLDFSH